MDIVRSTIFIAVTGVQWMFSRKTFACASDGWGLGLGLAWRLVAQLVVAVASLSYIQLQPALINPLPSPLEPNILKSFLSPLIPYLLG